MNNPKSSTDAMVLDSIAKNAPLKEFQKLVLNLFADIGISSFKLSWLDELRTESVWIESEYEYNFETKKLFFSFENREIAILYYNSDLDIGNFERYLKSIVNHCNLKRSLNRKNQKRVIVGDLEMASKMQQLLVPDNLFCNSFFCASGLYLPNFQVGGDFYDVIPINDYKIGFCIGDISGKGVNAAIIMSHFIGFIRSTLLLNIMLEEMVQIINEKMYELTSGEKFITLFLGIYNIEDKRLVYVNSGHVPIPIYDKEGIEWLDTGSTILGMFKDLPFIDLGKVHIEDKKQVLLYTDGLLNLNIDHEPFLSNSELSYILNQDCLGKTTSEITDYFREITKTIDVEEDLKDDISILALELG